jgi:aerobic-type carbon monoxide dehydrogenase small subunit (CoxS/CutS family)
VPLREPASAEVTFVLDGEERTATAWGDLSALLLIRLTLRHPRPRRGCEAGTCGTCESLVDGAPARLCQLNSLHLNGLTIETPLEPSLPRAWLG